MKKNKHNKKRNTAFLYEVLIKEMTKAVVSKDRKRKLRVVSVLKEFFNPNAILRKELSLYNTLLETSGLDAYTAEKLVYKVREAHSKLDQQQIHSAQGSLVKRVNKVLSKSVFVNFVPNYKSMATLSQLFDADLSAANIKRNVLLERQIVTNLMLVETKEPQNKMKPIDNLVFKTFANKFNETHTEGLLREQRELLNKYVFSFVDNGIDIKIYLNEELSRLYNVIEGSAKYKEIKNDNNMANSTKEVLAIIEGFKDRPIDKNMVSSVLKIQNLVYEITSK
tara:strand:+ start:4578 stop:5417 length:840 start_codon:yes stop_codon:yes gene_type:complete